MGATLEELPGALKTRSAGATIIQDVVADIREDSSGRRALFLVLVLSDPPPELETWAVEDLWEIRRLVRETVATQLPDLDLPWYVVFEPAHPDLPNDD